MPDTFTIGDHSYTTVLHPGTEGMQISSQILGMAAGPLASALDINAPQDLSGVSPDALGASLRAIFADPAFPRLIREILRHTTRDGQPLREDRHFDSAYRGNYGELAEAITEVITRNGFFPALGTWLGVMERAGLTLPASSPTPPASPDE